MSNTVKDNTTYNYITVITEDQNTVQVTQPVTNVIEVNTPGPIRNLEGGLANNFVLWTGYDSIGTSSVNLSGSTVQVTGSLDVSNGFAMSGSLRMRASGSVSLTASISTNGSVLHTGRFEIRGSRIFIGAQVSNGAYTQIGLTTITGSLRVSSSFSVRGPSTFIGDVAVTGSLRTSGSNTFIGNQTITGSVNISGSQTFVGTSAFFGNHTLSGSNTITGNTQLSGSLDVSGSSNFHNSTFIVTGSQYYTGSSAFDGNQEITGSLKVTGSFWMNGNRQFNYGAFSSTVDQTLPGPNESASFTYNTVDVVDGVTYSNNSHLNIPHTGIYNIQFSAQLLSAANNVRAYIWLKKNGANLDNTATVIALRNNEEAVAAWNWIYPFVAGDYVEIAWQSNNATTTLERFNASGNIPAVPSVIVTVTQVA